MAADVAAARAAAAGGGPPHGPGVRHLPLAEAQAAYEQFAAGAKFGKIVLVA